MTSALHGVNELQFLTRVLELKILYLPTQDEKMYRKSDYFGGITPSKVDVEQAVGWYVIDTYDYLCTEPP